VAVAELVTLAELDAVMLVAKLLHAAHRPETACSMAVFAERSGTS
jgi:hypothetical protein